MESTERPRPLDDSLRIRADNDALYRAGREERLRIERAFFDVLKGPDASDAVLFEEALAWAFDQPRPLPANEFREWAEQLLGDVVRGLGIPRALLEQEPPKSN